MKQRLHLIILLASLALSGMAQTIGEAFYIYRNDGQFNAFFRDEVDSIAYSYYDADSVHYDEVVTQIVYTADSIYKIPLAAIDSVAFVQLEKEYQPEVMRMDDNWLPYVVSVTDNSITFKSSTPKAFLPEIGQVIVAETYEAPFETGFAGRVSSRTLNVDGIEYQVDAVSLSDIYKQLVTVGFSSSEPEDNATGGAKGLNVYATSNAAGIRFPLPNVELSLGPVGFSCKPNIVLKYIVCVIEHNMKNYANVMVHQTYEGSASIDCKIDGSYTPEPNWLPASIPITTGVPGLYGAIRFGLFFRASGEVKLSATQPFTVSGVTGFTYTEEKGIQGINEWKATMHDTEISLGLDGSVSTGLAVRLEIGVINKRIASADVTAYLGPKYSGDFSLTTQGLSGGGLYSSIKDSEATLSLNAEVVPGYQCVINRWIGDVPHAEDHQELPISLDLGYDLNHWYVVPEFENLKWTPNDDTRSGKLAGDINRNLLPKVSLGWGLYDENDNLYKSYYFPATYRKIEDWKNNGLEYSIAALPAGGYYTAYPLVSLMGVEMRADEGVEISADPMVYNGQVTKKSVTCVTVTGSVEGISHGAVVDAGICYSDNPSSQNWNYASANKKTDGDFSVEIKGLSPKTKYYCCAYAYKDGEYYYADELMEFTTSSTASIVQITNFEQTDSTYSKDVSGYNHVTHYYKFTVTLQDNTDIADWGYVYKNSDGNATRISLKSQSSPYTRTGSVSYVSVHILTFIISLQGYVKYKGDAQYYYGDEKSISLTLKEVEFSCPDGNHPHYIDLSLPSGTKWACCNIGASSPEQYGSYLTFDEAQGYNPPSYDQIKELVNNCYYTETTQNGVKGGKFIGSNGGSVFLPAAGYRWSGEVYLVGSSGGYWSSTPRDEYSGYGLDAGSGKGWFCNDRRYGRPVRLVR